MAKQTFTSGQVLTAAEMNSLQENDYNWTVTTKTASYTLAAGDEGTRIVMNNAGATTITVDDAVFSAGDVVWIHNIGAGTCTITAGTATVSTLGELALEQYAGGHLYFTSAAAAIFFPTEQGGGGKILQVVSTTKTDTFSTSSTTFTDITGLAVSITPTSATSKVFVIVRANTACSTVANMAFRLMRDATAIEVGAASGSKDQATSKVTIAGGSYVMDATGTYLDSPATTSAISYHLEMMVQGGTGTINYISTENDVAGARDARTASTITALEVSA